MHFLPPIFGLITILVSYGKKNNFPAPQLHPFCNSVAHHDFDLVKAHVAIRWTSRGIYWIKILKKGQLIIYIFK